MENRTLTAVLRLSDGLVWASRWQCRGPAKNVRETEVLRQGEGFRAIGAVCVRHVEPHVRITAEKVS